MAADRLTAVRVRSTRVAELLVAFAHGAEQGVEHEAHGDQVTVERRPQEHVDGEYDGLDDVHHRPDGGHVVVLGRHEPRYDDPHDQRAEAEGDKSAEDGGQRGPAPAHHGRVAGTATGELVPGRVQRHAHPTRVGRRRVALEQAHEPVHDQHAHVGEHLDVVTGQVQPENLHRLQPEHQAHGRQHGRTIPSTVVQAALGRVQQLVHANGLEQSHVHDRAAVFAGPTSIRRRRFFQTVIPVGRRISSVVQIRNNNPCRTAMGENKKYEFL